MITWNTEYSLLRYVHAQKEVGLHRRKKMDAGRRDYAIGSQAMIPVTHLEIELYLGPSPPTYHRTQPN